MEDRRVEREEAFSIMALRALVRVQGNVNSDSVKGKYRSIMVIRGAMRPDAQAAEVMSEVIRQGRSSVFHLVSSRVIEELVGPFRDMMAEFGRPSKTGLPSV